MTHSASKDEKKAKPEIIRPAMLNMHMTMPFVTLNRLISISFLIDCVGPTINDLRSSERLAKHETTGHVQGQANSASRQ